jgi:hypothetical protein
MQGEPIEPVLALQKEFKLVPLSAYGNKAPSAPSNKTLPLLPAIKDGGLAFLEYLSFALKSNPIKAADEALFAQFSRIGLTAALGSGRLKVGWSTFFWIDQGKPRRVQLENQRIESVSRLFCECAKLLV